MPKADSRLQKAMTRFIAAHEEDPVTISVAGEEIPSSVFYHRRLTHWVYQLEPNASEVLVLATYCQHIRRWRIPRDRYPHGKSGYKRWRKSLARYHAEEAGQILRQVGYGDEIIGRVQGFLQKFRLKLDREMQILEDAICLVFLENELEEFSYKHDDAKLTEILRKTWQKMSPSGQQVALKLVENLPSPLQQLVTSAVS